MNEAVERRFVAVLFSDLSGFTRLSEGMDPEDVRDIVDALFQRFRATVESHGGVVDKFIGDAVMAVFGAPTAHEDDEARAVRTGLAMQRDLAIFNEERKLGLKLRIGINAGEVLWGRVGGGQATAMGDAVNVAQRLEGAAVPGAVLVSSAVERAARTAARFRPLEAISVKGREAKVEVFEAVEALPGATRGRDLPGTLSAMVGRDAELANLLGRFEAGQGGLVVVEGEAGIGKSRLLAELRAHARRRTGAWVAVGRAQEGVTWPLEAFGALVREEAGVPGLQAGDAGRIVESLRSQFREGSDIERENWAHLIALSIGYSLPDSRVRQLEPSRIAAETQWAWERWLLSRSGPAALLCLEDLHWADEGTVALLSHLVARLAGRPILFVAAARKDSALPAGWERLSLGDLTADGVRVVAESAFKGAVSEDLLRFLREKCGGHPYFLEELIRFLKEETLVSGSPAVLAAAPGRVPLGLQGLLVARLDALPHESKETVKAAAVLGREFWIRLLGALTPHAVEPSLAEARRRDMVFSRLGSLLPGDTECAFKHALLRDAAYGLLPKKDRARIHAAAAGILEGQLADGGRRVKALVARHREASGDVAAASRLLLEAAEEAFSQGAPREALQLSLESERLGGGARSTLVSARARFGLGEILQAAEAAGRAATAATAPAERAGAYRFVAQAYRRLGRNKEAAEALVLARRTLEAETGEPCLKERAWLQVEEANMALETGSWDTAQQLAEAGLQKMQERGDREGITAFLACRGQVHMLRGEFAEATAWLEKLRMMAEELGNRSTLASAFGNLGIAGANSGNPAAAEAAYAKSLALFRELGDRAGVSLTLLALGNLSYRIGDYDSALVRYGAASDLMTEIGDRKGMASCLGNIGRLLLRRGQPEKALEQCRGALKLWQEMGSPAGAASALILMSDVLSYQERFEEAVEQARAALAIRQEMGDRAGLAHSLDQLAVIHLKQGKLPEARSEALQALELLRALNDRRALAATLLNLGKIDHAERRPAEALQRYEESLALCRAIRQSIGVAATLSNIGDVHFYQGRLDAALKSYQEAVEFDRSGGLSVGLSNSLLLVGTVRYATGEFEAALESLAESVAIAGAMPDSPVLADAADLLAACHASQGRFAEARALFERSRNAAQARRDAARDWRANARLSALDAVEGRATSLAADIGQPPDVARDLMLRASVAESEAHLRRVRGDGRGARVAVESAVANLRSEGAPGLVGPLERVLQEGVTPHGSE